MNLKGKSGIYVYTFPNGKKYVGQSLDLQERLKKYKSDVKVLGRDSNRLVVVAIRKYGWNNVKIEYPFIVDRDKVNETDLSIILDVLELRYIRDFDCVNPNGYNLTHGADSTLFIPCESTEVVLKSINKEQSKPILIYDLEGKFVAEYNSIADCAYQLHLTESDIRKYANCRKYLRGLYMVKLKKGDIVPKSIIPYSVKQKEIINKVVKVVEEVKVVKKTVVVRKTAILQYSLDGLFCREWESISSASRYYKRSISLNKRSCAGFMWRVKTENYPMEIPSYIYRDSNNVAKYNSKYANGILQCDLNGVTIKRFSSAKEASEVTGISYNRIYGILNGTIKNPDYLWMVAW